MKTISALRLGSCAAAIIIGLASHAALAADNAPAVPQDQTQSDAKAQDGDKKAPESDDDKAGAEIVVTGIRGSIADARNQKRNAKQIVDSVVAEDVGKLPDNNVPEALARVTGVQIDRSHGEGSGVSIRGMTDIQTTVNGNEATSGVDRSMNLADIPAELLKSVQVYKTRTADQIEGGIAGTVNVELRRPLDLDKGLTVAGSFREVFSSLGNTKSPYASLLVGDRFETGIGEMGFLINGSYTKNHYFENFIESETPGVFFATDINSIPAVAQGNTIAPYAANYGVEEGSIERPSINAVWQWAPSDRLNFVLEGNYFSSKETRSRDRLHLVVRNGNYNLSGISYADNGNTEYNTVDQITVTPASGILGGGPEAYYEKVDSNNLGLNFETHWHSDHTHIDASVQYNHGYREYYGILSTYRFKTATSATIDFSSPSSPGNNAFITFNGADLSDPSQYYLLNFHDEQGIERSDSYSGQVDITQDVSNGFFRTFQMGARYSDRTIGYTHGYRDSFPTVNGSTVSLSDFPGASIVSSGLDYSGAPSWYHLDGATLMANLASIRSYLTTHNTDSRSDWSTVNPDLTLGDGYSSTENSFAVYAQMNYAFKLGRIPVDGVVGARAVNTWGNYDSYRTSITSGVVTYQPVDGRGNFIDVLPSANAIIHFTPKLQLRLAYTQNVQRVGFGALSPFRVIETGNSNVYAGNPDLNAYTEKSYDASLEYYFGRAGSISVAAYLKKPKGYIYYSGETEYVPELGTTATVWTNRNAGGGEFQGYELSAQTFFDFLPGILHNFGASANLTYLAKGNIEYPDGSDNNAVGMSKYTYNLALYYDTPVFSTRVAWNYRSRYRTGVFSDFPEYSPYMDATSRLDAAVNYTPFKFVTFSLEGTNLLKNNAQMWWGKDRLLPYGVRWQARTVQLGARFRF